ncbi:MAG TPA: cell division protein FtsK, partial [Alcanivorax sp.]|nr:cell division protein FtsK [Alcanivorax sp.]
KVLDEVDERLKKNGRYRKPQDIEVDISRYEELKTTLKNHAEKINRPWKNTGKTLHEIFMAATRYRNAVGLT